MNDDDDDDVDDDVDDDDDGNDCSSGDERRMKNKMWKWLKVYLCGMSFQAVYS